MVLVANFILAGAAFVVFAIIGSWMADGPSTPNPAAGLVIPFTEHSHTHYVTTKTYDVWKLSERAVFVTWPPAFILMLSGMLNGLIQRGRSA